MSARDKRRLALIGRQLMIARIARREALGALADALAEERRSRDLAQRSRGLAASYAGRRGAGEGDEVAGRMRFAGALSRLADDAGTGGAQAAREAEEQARALAGTERRIERLETREAEASRALAAARERRLGEAQGALARKLQRRLP
ncbi:MAG: hypothetical protein RIC51_01880 [Erythrobacter sp.]|uniref:hypothetical protein n=1 Tax=Erythrobacter sp. TaxID=1042 RepID=UPI0032EB2B2E